MGDKLTLADERIVAGTHGSPAVCGGCNEYTKVFNLCANCGRDERARYGCEHRIGEGDICSECRGRDIRLEQPSETEKLLLELSGLKLANNRLQLMDLQTRAMRILGLER